MAKPTIEVFDENAVEKIERMYEAFRREAQEVRGLLESHRGPQSQVQPIIGTATSSGGGIEGTYKVDVYHGPYRNADNDDDGEFSAYRVEAKPWIEYAGAPVSGERVLMWQLPFGQWYYVTTRRTLLGKLDGTLSQGSSATMSIWTGQPASESDSGDNITVYDWLLSSGQTIPSGTKVIATPINGYWYVTERACS